MIFLGISALIYLYTPKLAQTFAKYLLPQIGRYIQVKILKFEVKVELSQSRAHRGLFMTRGPSIHFKKQGKAY